MCSVLLCRTYSPLCYPSKDLGRRRIHFLCSRMCSSCAVECAVRNLIQDCPARCSSKFVVGKLSVRRLFCRNSEATDCFGLRTPARRLSHRTAIDLVCPRPGQDSSQGRPDHHRRSPLGKNSGEYHVSNPLRLARGWCGHARCMHIRFREPACVICSRRLG